MTDHAEAEANYPGRQLWHITEDARFAINADQGGRVQISGRKSRATMHFFCVDSWQLALWAHTPFMASREYAALVRLKPNAKLLMGIHEEWLTSPDGVEVVEVVGLQEALKRAGAHEIEMQTWNRQHVEWRGGRLCWKDDGSRVDERRLNGAGSRSVDPQSTAPSL
jgi:hypothetical protein